MKPEWWRNNDRQGRWFLVDDDDPTHAPEEPEFIGSMWRDDDESGTLPKGKWEVRIKRPEYPSVLLTHLDAHLILDEAKDIAKTLMLSNWRPS